MKQRFLIVTGIAIATIVACSSSKPVTNSTSGNEIEALIQSMTIEEKVGQMTQLNLDVVCEGEVYNLVEPHHLDMVKLRKALVQYHVGSILNCGGHAYPREQWHELISGIQKIATTETRLKIPVLYGIDAIHGANYVMGSTLFPQQLAQAASFDKDLVKQAAEVTAYETRAAGIPWNFSPVLDVGRNPLWSRFFETYGEDPLVCTQMGHACVVGYQHAGFDADVDKNHVAACMKHFLGYSGMRTGKDRTPAYIPDNQLREIFLPSFKRAIETGAMTVMINSGEINGTPVHADKRILTDLLRTELGFKGVAVTDWEDIIKLQVNHRVAPTLKDAVLLSIEAGIDMCMVPNDYNFSDLLIELTKEGKISEERLNTSVRRILELKKKLGILKADKVPAIADYPKFGSAEHQSLSKKIALGSITLLENKNNTLPFDAGKNILVTGPSANALTLLNGAWTRTWQGTDAKWDDTSRNTIYEALKQQCTGSVELVEGCELEKITNLDAALEASKKADIIVACIGELPSTEKPGDIDDLDLPQAQIDYVLALISTGKPVVLVMVENRPRIVREIADKCAAVVMAYQPGEFGGDALAEILVGKANPCGKLPFTYPRYNNSLLTYDHKYTEAIDQQFGDKAFKPQWEFGYGLSYSEIIYKSLSAKTTNLSGDMPLELTVEIENKSARNANESILIFSRDHYASTTPSVKKLIAFSKIDLPANKSNSFEFLLDFSKIMRELKQPLEDGAYDIYIGSQKTTIQYSVK
ncbi:MAG: glycoside hydrolase family 3 N-terminal domain-containing protein [Flavobacteriales bacterium]